MTTTPFVAGPEMDHLIATRVLGMTYSPRFPDDRTGYYYAPGPSPRGIIPGIISEEMPDYSTDLGAAAAVLDWLSVRGHVVLSGQQGNWDCQVDLGRAFCVENGDTPAEAICRLALAVKEDAG